MERTLTAALRRGSGVSKGNQEGILRYGDVLFIPRENLNGCYSFPGSHMLVALWTGVSSGQPVVKTYANFVFASTYTLNRGT